MHLLEITFGRNYVSPKACFPEFTLARVYTRPKLNFPENLFSRNYILQKLHFLENLFSKICARQNLHLAKIPNSKLGSNPNWAIISSPTHFWNRQFFFTLDKIMFFSCLLVIASDKRVLGFILWLRLLCISVLMHFTAELRLFVSHNLFEATVIWTKVSGKGL